MTAPVQHPGWCDLQHGDTVAFHEAEVGVRLDLTSGVSYGVYLQQMLDQPARVLLIRYAALDTTATSLSLLEAAILRDAVTEGLDLVAGEVSR